MVPVHTDLLAIGSALNVNITATQVWSLLYINLATITTFDSILKFNGRTLTIKVTNKDQLFEFESWILLWILIWPQLRDVSHACLVIGSVGRKFWVEDILAWAQVMLPTDHRPLCMIQEWWNGLGIVFWDNYRASAFQSLDPGPIALSLIRVIVILWHPWA